MPELPEVETTVAGLRQVLDGAQLTLVEPRRADLRFPFPVDLRQRLTGARITGLGRRAKYGLIDTDRGDTMIFHLGMSGRWRIDPSEVGKHDHLLLETASHRLALNDPRRFGFVHLTPTDALDAYPPFAALGPEPLGDALTADYLAQALEGRAAPIKAMLLDQRIIAGLGNIYVCEALNIARISPTRAAGRISRARLARLVEAIRAVLVAAIAAGGSTLRDYARPDGELGYFAKDWRVYGREGLACPCGGTVKRRVDSGRSTFYCPTCQS
ncbi:formamidopyrimidine-DNA glycosylase [Sphingobium sp. B1D7B]|uniref:bifunctional DNA-formamidopyrimidine glycosylase/DNA-(apurinic or apyrimidinic site) lyase n=1 Tax=Sphingobium TaxID=165695 RepID=UPI0015ECA4C0|nr:MULTISPECIES: bifunctional DNA-formamidopyrimidine glycosylase/DNA-(apurinic or apyrimidinic site) lyase [Sphingobium]MCW2362949.1 formamidopyrimidine-DNA glycosylase [Sphingobium sp. B10D3B]MCW2400371.1 formamidopyrimidine-DNA glycosylase [Sphingobium sp. B10D7B]MCW2404683.1 formamidopyrimidine-DNA glycosylase [Sphingobium sp. B1D7B]MCW2407349.1 formamidopyrimidine-DNA glycosylase [Sphingobium xanthum]